MNSENNHNQNHQQNNYQSNNSRNYVRNIQIENPQSIINSHLMISQSNLQSSRLKTNRKFIQGITRQDVSQQIANWPFILDIFNKNSASDQVKLIESFMKVPSFSDQPGFIYGFMDEKQNSVLSIPFWIKMGRTNNKVPQNRIFQWQKDDQKNFTEIFTVRSLYNHKLQSLVHTLFAYARQHRKMTIKTQSGLKDVNRKEWFKFEEPTMTAAAVNILNYIMDIIHEKYWKKNHDSKFIKSKVVEKSNKEDGKVYYNKTLHQIQGELFGTIKYLTEMVSLGAKNKMENIIDSVRNDLSVQIQDKKIKQKLKQIKTLNEGLDILKKGNRSVMGQQIESVFDKLKESKILMNSLNMIFTDFENRILNQLQKLEQNTEVNFIIPSNNLDKQTKNTSHQKLDSIDKQQKDSLASRISQFRNQIANHDYNTKIYDHKGSNYHEKTKVQQNNQQQSQQKFDKQIQEINKKIQRLQIYEDEDDDNDDGINDDDDNDEYYDCEGQSAEIEKQKNQESGESGEQQDGPDIQKYKRENKNNLKDDCQIY